MSSRFPNPPESEYSVDIVLCVDASERMQRALRILKRDAPTCFSQVLDEYRAFGKRLKQLRVKLITFGNGSDEESACRESEFFTFDTEEKNEAFCAYVDSIEAIPCRYETFANLADSFILAATSDWNKTGVFKRHIIALITDSYTASAENDQALPDLVPVCEERLSVFGELWEGIMNKRAKQLCVIAPNYEYPLENLDSRFSRSVLYDLGYYYEETNRIFAMLVCILESAMAHEDCDCP